MKHEDFYGRLLTQSELPAELVQEAVDLSAFEKNDGRETCRRCRTELDLACKLPSGAYYCRHCLIFGRNQTDRSLYCIPQRGFPKQTSLVWQGTLTPYQEAVSQQLLKALEARENILVHAVTGAGKTEMIYQTVARVVDSGGSVALVSSRIDVCKELHLRISQDFSCDMVLLHGESESYHRCPLIIATVHQLYKFYQAFDLIIIDEVDAFPFVDDASLYQAVANAKKLEGLTFYLTATSTAQLEKEVASGRLRLAHLARRFHGNPLVVPNPSWMPDIRQAIQRGKLPAKLLEYLNKQGKTPYPLLIFFPHIDLGQTLVGLLRTAFPNRRIGFVSSLTEDRDELVQAFRNGELDLLLTTTILERGVTFPCVDVIVLWANYRLFTSSSLIQIGGRVGRSKERPTGDLIFFHNGLTNSIKKAIREIRDMNQKGGFG